MNNNRMKILITGANGLLGSNLLHFFSGRPNQRLTATSLNESKVGLDIEFLPGDLTYEVFAKTLVEKTSPDVIINTVALVDIEKCESDPVMAHKVNVTTVENLAKAVAGRDCRLIHISTDHFFDGTQSFYTEDAPPSPVNNYGRTKLEAEKVCLAGHANAAVVRTNFYGWCRGAQKPNFGEWMYRSLRDQAPIKLFSNYFYTPIEVDHLARALEMVAGSDFNGVLNIAGGERVSKYDFGKAMAEVFGFSLKNVTSVELDPTSFAVKRQPDLSLSTERFSKLFKWRAPGLKEGLTAFKESKPEAV